MSKNQGAAIMEEHLDLAVNQVYLVDAVYDRLIETLMRGRIRPGQRLYIGPLAEQLNVSPTPLRQALMRMEGEGLVKTIPRRGIYVIKSTPAEVRDLFDVRLMCELHAIERCFPRVTSEHLEHLECLVAECDKALTDEEHSEWTYGQKDRELHSYLVGLAGNTLLSELHSNLRVQSLVIAQSPQITGKRAQETSIEHHRILSAMRERNVEAAQKAMTDHLNRALEAACAALENQ